MVSGIVSFSCSLFDDDPFGIAPTAPSLGVDIILPIIASWKTSFSVLEVTPPDVARQRHPTALSELFEQIVGFLRGDYERGGLVNFTRSSKIGIGIRRSVTEAGSGDRDRRRWVGRAQ
jgi:hypothetical protein